MNNDRFIYLLTKKKSEGLSTDEQSELTAFLNEHEENRLLSESMDQVFDSSLSFQKKLSIDEVEDALKRFHLKKHASTLVSDTSKKYRTLKLWSVAASVALIIGLAAFFFLQPDRDPLRMDKVVATQKGIKTNLVLPDGTKVWVNADTKLTYDENFNGNTREVTLAGEAYFDVTKDPSRPFIVHTSTYDVRVLGTAFNVRAYPNEANTQTTLLRGKVEVLLKHQNNKKFVLKPNEKIIVQNNIANQKASSTVSDESASIQLQNIASARKDSAVVETEWTKNRLVFEQEKIENLLPVLERWYNVTIELRHSPDGILYNGTFENDSLEDVMESLKAVGGFKYQINKDKVIIY